MTIDLLIDTESGVKPHYSITAKSLSDCETLISTAQDFFNANFEMLDEDDDIFRNIENELRSLAESRQRRNDAKFSVSVEIPGFEGTNNKLDRLICSL